MIRVFFRSLGVLSVFFCLSLFSVNSLARVSPDIKWKVLKTAHFEIIYDSKHKALAQQYANYAEESRRLLQGSFSEMPKNTIMVIDDSTDLSNGSATHFPYSLIRVYPVLPNSLDSISYYGNWGQELVLHEYTHSLTFYPVHSFYRPFYWLFGSIVHPTAYLPRWWMEGLAVEMESRHSKHGRLRSPGSSATLRALVLDELLQNETIDRINESSIPSYPYGQRPYLLGGILWHSMMSRTNSDKLPDELLQDHSRRLPFLLNTPYLRRSEIRYQDLLQQTYEDLEQRTQAQVERIQSVGVDSSKPLFDKEYGHLSPTLSPDQLKLAFVHSRIDAPGELILVERADKSQSFAQGKRTRLTRGQNLTRLNWTPDSKSLIFDKLQVHKRDSLYNDLFQFDLETKKIRRLTWGARAREPKLSPKGDKIVFVASEAGRTHLMMYQFANQKISRLYSPPFQSRISRPEFVRDHVLVFSGRSPAGLEQLFTLNLATKKRGRVLREFKNTGQAQMTSEGLIFSSYDSGVSNLYLADQDLQSATAMTNSVTGVLQGEFDPARRELISLQITGYGPQLHITENPRSFSPLKIEPLQKLSLPSAQTRSPALQNTEVEERSYYSMKYLLPRYWIPFIYPVENGILFQGSTANQDPLGKNSYLIEAAHDSLTKKLSYGVSWLNRSTPIDISLSHAQYNEFLAATSQTLSSSSSGASFGFYIPGLSHRFQGALGGSTAETEILGGSIKRQGPNAKLSYSNIGDPTSLYRGGFQWSLGYSNYLKSETHLGYERFQTSLLLQWVDLFPLRHSLTTQFKGALSPEMPFSLSPIIGEKSLGGNYLVNLINTPFLVRGYPSAAFVGRKMLNFNTDYRFPLADIYKGKGFFPLFFKDLQMGIFADGVMVDGAYFETLLPGYRRSTLSRSFWSSGIEFHQKTTAAYQVPLTFTLGLYYGFNREAGGGFMPFLSIGLL